MKTGSVLFFLFLTVLFLEVNQIFSAFDPAITRGFQQIVPRFLDMPLSFFSLLGSFEITAFLVGCVGLWILRRQKRIFWPLLLFGMILVFEFIGKLLLYHPGPPPNVFRYTLPFSLPTAHIQTSYSFPSGHVSRTVFLTVVGSVIAWRTLAGKRLKGLLVAFFAILAIIMVVSRIYLGEHWASDTLGGVLLGGAMGFFAASYYHAKT